MAHIAISRRSNPIPPSRAIEAPCDWIRAHEELTRLAKARALLEWEEGRGLRSALRAGVHLHLGFASFVQYVESLFGYKPRTTEEKLRVAEALEALPVLGEELRTGGLSWSAVRELSRVATAATERAWLEVARGKSVRQIEDWVSGRKPGDWPGSPADSALRRHTLVFEVHAETLATFREALSQLRRDAGGPLDEEAALLLMARQVLGGPRDHGRASYQTAFTICDQCGRGFQQGQGERLEVEPVVMKMAMCDAQDIGHVAPTGARLTHLDSNTAVGCSPSHNETPTAIPARVSSETRDCTPSVTNRRHDADHARVAALAPQVLADVGTRSPPMTAHVGALSPQTTADVGGEPPARDGGKASMPRSANARAARAKQAIPPATRRFVLRRDSGQCVVPGCRHATYLDLHHLELRSEGRDHDPNSLVTLCAAHHRALHRGDLIVEGSVGAGLVFRHSDGSSYRGAVSPRAVAAQTRAFAALRRLGFREGDVRRTLDRLRSEFSIDRESPEQVVRAALRVLTTTSAPATE